MDETSDEVEYLNHILNYWLSTLIKLPCEQVTFLPESVEPIVNVIIESVLKDKMYNDSHVQKWIDEICARITKELADMNKPFKYLGKFHIIRTFFHV